MRVRVINRYPPGWGGRLRASTLRGLGDDSVDPSGDFTSGVDTSTLTLPIDTSTISMPPITPVTLNTGSTDLSNVAAGELNLSTAAGLPTINSSQLSIPGYTYNPSSGTFQPSGGGSGVTLAQLLQGAATAASTAAAINKSLQSPALIPGTSLVYNPATGQITSGVATNTTALGGVLSNPTTLVFLAIAAVFIVMSMGERR